MTYTQLAYRVLAKMPHGMFERFSKILLHSEANREWIAKERIKNYGLKLIEDFDGECRKIAKKKKVMVIKKGEFSYSYLNNAYIGNMLCLILYAMYRGYMPDIQINADNSEQWNNWDWYFVQPMECYFSDVDRDRCRVVECSKTGSIFSPWATMIWNEESEVFRVWKCVYQKFLRFNKTSERYFAEDHNGFDAENALGVIVRGTDYTATRPKWHPVQPDVEDVLAKAKEEWATGRYTSIYVATEEKRLFDQFVNTFGQEHVVTMQKTFYDDIYYQQNLSRIGDVKFDRENDNYLKGIEYLSTLMALSKCASIIGGNCGGTQFAVMMSRQDCKRHIFNLGVY